MKPEQVMGIQGLRGIAVLAVIANHMHGNLLPGGYLGVDVFFVISGYVITSSLSRSLDSDWKLYLKNFYARRIKRLFPALFVFIFLTYAVSYSISMDMSKATLRTGATALLGLSNLYQIRIGNDYFGLASDQNFFTHTWSLGVEEQFYLLFPIVLFVLFRYRTHITTYLLFLSASSFAFFVILFFYDLTTQYYFPVSRFWEFLAGAITFLIASKTNGPIKQKKFLPNIVLIVVLSSFFTQHKYFLFTSVLICLSSSYLIFICATRGHKVLEKSFLTFTGDLSYSLYLYHFPLIAILNIEGGLANDVLSLSAIYVISFLSLKYIERPLIRDQKFLTKSKIFALFPLLSGSAFLFIVLGNVYFNDEALFSPPPTDVFRSCSTAQLASKKMGQCHLGSDNSLKTVFFIGDSHAAALAPFINEIHSKYFHNMYLIETGGLFTRTLTSSTNSNLDIAGIQAMDFVKESAKSGDTVVIVNQFLTWFSKTYNDDPSRHRLFADRKLVSKNTALKMYSKDLSRAAKELKEIGVNIILFAPFPDFKTRPHTCYSPLFNVFEKNDLFGLLNARLMKKCSTMRSEQEIRRKNTLTAFRNVEDENSNLSVFDPIDMICGRSLCSSYKNGDPIYFDDDHVNSKFSPYLLKAFFKRYQSNLTPK